MPNSFENDDDIHLHNLLYLVPIFGAFPALWTLYHKSGNRQQRNLSRLALTLAVVWFASYLVLGLGSEAAGAIKVPLLFTSTVISSAYFLGTLGLMAQLYRRRVVSQSRLRRLEQKQRG
jgi:hypothetical protein